MWKIVSGLLIGGMFFFILNQNREVEYLRHPPTEKIIVIEKEIVHPSKPPPVNTVTVTTVEHPGPVQSTLNAVCSVVAVTLAIPILLCRAVSEANL